jgi:TP901 family phage tail tape measure protein
MAENTIGTAVMEITADTSGVLRSVDELGTSLRQRLGRIGADIGKAGGVFSGLISLPVAGFFMSAATTAGDFEKTLNTLGAVSGATTEELKRLKDQALELGQSTSFSATDAAQAQVELAKAGLSVEQILAAMPSVLQLAAAGQLDVGEAASIAAAMMNTFGLSGEGLARVNDVLAAAANASATGVREIGTAMAYVGPVAYQLGVSFEETTAAIALLSNVGIDASQAGTALRGALSTLINPTQQQKKVLDELGISVYDSQGRFVGLIEIIRQLEQSGADTAQILAIFGDRAGPAMAALLQIGSDSLGEMTKQLENSGGTAERVANSQMAGFRGQLEELNGALETLKIRLLMDTGLLEKLTLVLTKAADAVSKLTNWFARLDPRVQRLLLGFLGVFAVLGPLMVLIAGTILVLSVLGSTVAMVGIIIASLVVIGYALYTIFSLLWPEIENFFRTVGTKAREFGNDVRNAFEMVKGWLERNWPLVASIILGPMMLVVSPVLAAVNMIVGGFFMLKDRIIGALETAWGFIKSFPDRLYNAGREMIDKLISGISSKLPSLSGTVDRAFNTLKKLNPFARFSPSLVDQVRRGTHEIMQLYTRMDVNLRSTLEGVRENVILAPSAVPAGAAAPVYVNVEGPVLGDLGFDEWLARRLQTLLRREGRL